MEITTNLSIPVLAIVYAFVAALLIFVQTALTALMRSRYSYLDELQEESAFGVRRALLVLDRAELHIARFKTARFVLVFTIGLLYLLSLNAVGANSAGLASLVWPVALAIFLVIPVLVLSEIGSALAFSKPERVLCWLGALIAFCSYCILPVHLLVSSIYSGLLALFGLTAVVERELLFRAEDLSEVVEKSGEAGELEAQERELLRGVLSISEKTIGEIMTPRQDIACVREEDSLEQIVEAFLEAGYSRLLVIGSELDDVKGILLAKDLLPLVGQQVESFTLTPLLRKPIFLEGATSLHDSLLQLREQAVHLAVVLDEHGGVDGVVSMEDLIEELVGDIFDEHDSPEEEQEVERTRSGDLLVDGGTLLGDLKDIHGISFPEGEYDTMAGFVIHELGRIPDIGDAVRFNGCLVQVEQVDQNRVTLLRIREVDLESGEVLA